MVCKNVSKYLRWTELKRKISKTRINIKENLKFVFCISLTTKNKKSFFYKKLENVTFYEKYKVKESVIVVSQAKIYDKKRFIKQIWYLDNTEFEIIKKDLRNIYF